MMQLFCLVLLVVACSCKQLPSNFKKCNRKQSDFDQCLTVAVEDAISQLKAPINELGLPNLAPLAIPALSNDPGKGSVGFSQRLKDMTIAGFTNSKCSKVEMHFEAKTLVMNCVTPELKINFNYEFKGQVMTMPINANGLGSTTWTKPNMVLTLNLEEYMKKGKKYFKVVDSKFTLKPELITFHFDNVAEDETMSRNINQMFNDNWKDLEADVGASYGKAFAQIFAGVANNLMGKVPVSELFGDE